MRQIRVLVVDDSLFFRDLLLKNLNKDPEITIVAAVKDAFEAQEAIKTYQPDVMTLDIEMPGMTGLELLDKLMPRNPMPVVVISALSDKVFDALQAGAVDFVAKPALSDKVQLEEFVKKELVFKIKAAANAKIGNVNKKNSGGKHSGSAKHECSDMIVAIGASTGGTDAIANVLKGFGPDIPGVVVVQHMPAGFTKMYAKRLDDQCRVHVKEAEDGDRVLPGHVLLAPGGDKHMKLVNAGGKYEVKIVKGGKVNGHCPSVDVLFDSVATHAKNKAIGIILTGMGGDGAKGLLSMRKAGASTIGQDESTCVVYGMPKVAFELGAVEFQEKLLDIAEKTYQIINKR